MKSVRFSRELEESLRRAAEVAGTTESEFIRDAVETRCNQVLGDTLAGRLRGYIGSIQSGSGGAVRNHEVFTNLVVAKHSRRRPVQRS